MSSCGDCSMCCKFMSIPLLGKADGEWCRFCTKRSCSIYADRPPVCQDFKCLWLETQNMEEPLPPELRPDRCKVMIGGTTREDCVMFYVDKDRPEAWRREDVMQIIAKLVMAGVYAIGGTSGSMKRRFFYRKGDAVHHRWVDMGPPDAEGTQYVISDLSFLNEL